MLSTTIATTVGIYRKDSEELSLETFKILLPVVVIISILLIFGVFGNVLACIFYGFKMKPGPSQCFIFSLTVFDLMVCCISMPMEIIDIRYFDSFPDEIICKTLRFVNYFASIASGAVLIAIAVDRYRKICKPFGKQLTIKHTRICICLLAVLSVFLSWPSLFVYTVTEVKASDGSVGYDCTTDINSEFNIYFFAYNIVLMVFFVLTMLVLTTIYIIVGRNLRKHRVFRTGTSRQSSFNRSDARSSQRSGRVKSDNNSPKPAADQTNVTDKNSSEKGDTSGMLKQTASRLNNRNSELIETSKNRYGVETRRSRNMTLSSKRYTCISISITLAFVLSFLPYLIISIWRTIHQSYEKNLSQSQFIAVEMFVRSFLVNSAVNPFIYGVFNTSFREFLRKISEVCFCCKLGNRALAKRSDTHSQSTSV